MTDARATVKQKNASFLTARTRFFRGDFKPLTDFTHIANSPVNCCAQSDYQRRAV